ncbi:MAG: molybdopterin-binding protein [Rhodobacteraceae bacterium]|nr:molybdopterin-binding protein [Paracoccaceae bacterium]
MNPTAAILLIGDEILSGRTQDTNGNHLAKKLTAAGIDLLEIRVVPDDHKTIKTAINDLRGRYTHVFTSGGIGPTHDDITADAIAAAFKVNIDVREDARAILASHYANPADLNEMRLRMARIPDGATLIDNPVSKAPGFSLGNVHVMAGVPVVFAAMVESLLPTLTGGLPLCSVSVRVEQPEGQVAMALADIAAAFPDVSIGSYPFVHQGVFGTSLVARSPDKARLAVVEARFSTLR